MKTYSLIRANGGIEEIFTGKFFVPSFQPAQKKSAKFCLRTFKKANFSPKVIIDDAFMTNLGEGR